MLPPAEAIAAVNEAFTKQVAHGYVPACGTHRILYYKSRLLDVFQEPMKPEAPLLSYGHETIFS